MQTGNDMVKLFQEGVESKSLFWDFTVPFLVSLAFVLVGWLLTVLLLTSGLNQGMPYGN